jgi:hypothetical protein
LAFIYANTPTPRGSGLQSYNVTARESYILKAAEHSKKGWNFVTKQPDAGLNAPLWLCALVALVKRKKRSLNPKILEQKFSS